MSTRNDTDSLLLDQQVCFALYAASRAVTDVYRPLLAELGLTYPQYLVMLALWEREPCTVREIGTALELDYGTVSPLLKRLEGQGLLLRRRSAADERQVEVELTPEGRALRDQATRIPDQIGCAVGLDADARTRLIAELREVAESVRAHIDARDQEAQSQPR